MKRDNLLVHSGVCLSFDSYDYQHTKLTKSGKSYLCIVLILQDMAAECGQSFIKKTVEVRFVQTMYASSGNLNLFKLGRDVGLLNCDLDTNLLS